MQNERKSWSLLIEGTAIVVSILLAFAIDAWWEARADREAEKAAVTRLLVEFEKNLAQLKEIKSTHQKALEATEQLLAMIQPNPSGLSGDKDIGQILVTCLTNPSFNPQLGATNSLIATGNLDLIRDVELQTMLTEWPSYVDNLTEWQHIERRAGEELILPLTYDYIAWPDIDFALGAALTPSPFKSDYDGLFSSRRFEGMLDNRRWNLREILEDIQTLEMQTVALIKRLDSWPAE